ncbi:lymphocyte antigen 6H isoform X7 [Cavia porcellus]|uniref:lymphocyte antigen 6H isoform X7 n=1 Tax=Cavia porcellus TaxID=10141 RepID=UPI002FE30BC0
MMRARRGGDPKVGSPSGRGAVKGTRAECRSQPFPPALPGWVFVRFAPPPPGNVLQRISKETSARREGWGPVHHRQAERGPRLRLRSPKDEAAPGFRSAGRPKGTAPRAAHAAEPGVRTRFPGRTRPPDLHRCWVRGLPPRGPPSTVSVPTPGSRGACCLQP